MRSAALRALLLAQLLLALVLGDDGSAARGAVATGEIVNLVGGEHLCPDGRGNLFPARHYRVFGGDEGVLSTREDCNAAVAQHLHDHAGQPCCAYDGFDRQRCCAEGACSAGAARTRAAHKNHFEKLMSPREDLAYVAIYKNGYRTLKTFLPRVERLFGSEAAAGEVRNYNSGSAEAVEAFQRLEAKRGVVFTFVRNPLERLLSAFNEVRPRLAARRRARGSLERRHGDDDDDDGGGWCCLCADQQALLGSGRARLQVPRAPLHAREGGHPAAAGAVHAAPAKLHAPRAAGAHALVSAAARAQPDGVPGLPRQPVPRPHAAAAHQVRLHWPRAADRPRRDGPGAADGGAAQRDLAAGLAQGHRRADVAVHARHSEGVERHAAQGGGPRGAHHPGHLRDVPAGLHVPRLRLPQGVPLAVARAHQVRRGEGAETRLLYPCARARARCSCNAAGRGAGSAGEPSRRSPAPRGRWTRRLPCKARGSA
mmetsp:Transcript_3144/g.11340  ORF Transcript_3144/g.11340 Transcript_3144/m.11340 type:complete len:483 (-) Transcript_3144:493-1941(-)